MDDAWTSSPGVDDAEVVGCVGPLVVASRGPAGAGEVLVRIRGGRETYLAWSAEPLPCGTEVLVIDIRSPRTVDVVPWTEKFSVGQAAER